MPKISVFTPTHDPRWLVDCEKSLDAQTYRDFEWQVYENDGEPVGLAKRNAVDLCSGEILVELDHDDTLDPLALAMIAREFEAGGFGFVYSDTVQMRKDGKPDRTRFDARYGWRYGELPNGYLECQALAPTPHNVSYIWYAPNHVRAFRRDIYEAVGGYDPERDILDDQDLMCRLYQATPFRHISLPLYYQRIHPANTQVQAETNARIQRETVGLYDRYIQPNVLAWSRRKNLLAVDLGAAHNAAPGYLSLDLAPGGALQADAQKLPFQDGSVGVLRAVDFLEHVKDRVALFNEFYRVLAPGGMLLSLTPSTDGWGAFCDPTHVSFYNEAAFWYFTMEDKAQYVPEIACKFQVSRLFTYEIAPHMSYVCANLIKLGGPRNGGLLHWKS